VLAAAARHIVINDDRRILATPWPAVSGHRPKEAPFVLPRPGSSTGALVLSMKSLVDCLRSSISRS
jgi:hypothetical protein